jgi:nucleotide-binding universal stress UspA family protein
MMPTPLAHRFRLILAGVDFSLESGHALRYAVATARRCGGRVLALHVIDPLLSTAAATAYAERPLVDEARAELDRFVRRTLGAEAAVSVTCEVMVGTTRQVLIDESRRRHPDVVVLGTQGRGGFSKVFFGSTTEALLRRYHGAVMVVPPKCGDPDAHWPGGSIVAAVPAGLHHRAMMSAAARTAEVFGAWLTVVPPEPPGGRTRWHPAPLVVLPMPDSARLETFRQGTQAYEFVRRVGVPVLVMHTGRRIGHVELPKQVA